VHLDTGSMAEIQRSTYVRVVRWSALLGITLAAIGAVLIVIGLASVNRGPLWSAAAVVLPFSLIPLVFAGLLGWFVSLGAAGWSESAYRKSHAVLGALFLLLGAVSLAANALSDEWPQPVWFGIIWLVLGLAFILRATGRIRPRS
jgi:membrane-bound ClpP family serine protease